MKKISTFIILCFISIIGYSQNFNLDSSVNLIKKERDSVLESLRTQKEITFKTEFKKDSIKIVKEYAEKIKWDRVKAIEIFPLINAGEASGVAPILNPEVVPDQKIQYKLLFELTTNNSEGSMSEINEELTEVARIINLHIASGIPLKNITPVIVAHGGVLNAFVKNDVYHNKYKVENPNIKLINELEKIGTKFIACGQAMTLQNIQKDAFLPQIKVSLTAKTVLSSYQLNGFVLMKVDR